MTAVVLAVEMSAQCAFLVAMGPPHSPEPILILTKGNDWSTPNLRNEQQLYYGELLLELREDKKELYEY